MRKSILLASLALAACAGKAPSAPVEVANNDGSICRPNGLDRFVGEAATSELGAEMLRATAARTLRWVPEGTMITMDFRSERLTVHLDRANRVERAVCG
jgi:hypothetical protein